jgi:hypothetical protein
MLRNLRLLSILAGVLLLGWLPFEDGRLTWVLVFAGVLCALGAGFVLINKKAPEIRTRDILLAGLLAGLMITPVALFLMAFKSGIHDHGTPDFTLSQAFWVILRTPFWTAAGVLIGLGAVQLRAARLQIDFRRDSYSHPEKKPRER